MKTDIDFISEKKFELISELGSGACGKTVLLRDPVIDLNFVCKKFQPCSDENRDELFEKFLNEAKIMISLLHRNIVRIFNWYMYPKEKTGYILMEYIEGIAIDKYLKENPEKIEQIFLQVISGFMYLAQESFLHRDIRSNNILVNKEGVVKIIDFGFGKQIVERADFDKSISLNLWCDKPKEFMKEEYTFKTEVYFIGQLFRLIIQENRISGFKYEEFLDEMCKYDPEDRIASFALIDKQIQKQSFNDTEFTEDEILSYRTFADYVYKSISKISDSVKINLSPEDLLANLNTLHESISLEEYIPDVVTLLRFLINGTYYYTKNYHFPVYALENFISLLQKASPKKRRIIVKNLNAKIDTLPKYKEKNNLDDDLPF